MGYQTIQRVVVLMDLIASKDAFVKRSCSIVTLDYLSWKIGIDIINCRCLQTFTRSFRWKSIVLLCISPTYMILRLYVYGNNRIYPLFYPFVQFFTIFSVLNLFIHSEKSRIRYSDSIISGTFNSNKLLRISQKSGSSYTLPLVQILRKQYYPSLLF